MKKEFSEQKKIIRLIIIRIIRFILNEDMNNIIKIINLPEDSSVLIDGRTETIKHEKKHKNMDFLKLC